MDPARKKSNRKKGMEIQKERGFQKQRNVFLGNKLRTSKKPGKKGARYYKDVGLGFKTPKEAVEGNYIDKKCPFTGSVNIRGRIIKGVVVSTKMQRTIVVRRDYLHYVKKYDRFERRHRNISAHCSPCFEKGLKPGDVATIGECRPLSKTVRFNVLKIETKKDGEESVKTFQMF